MDENEFELRDRLRRTWVQLIGRLHGSEFPAHMVFETLSDVATHGMSQEFGASAAAQMLRLNAAAIERSERDRVTELLTGSDHAGGS